MQSTLYLHCGLPKTGTTFLRGEVVSHLPVDTLIKPKSDLFNNKRNWVGVLEEAFNKSPVIWDDLGEKIFGDLLDGTLEKGREDVLISEEHVCQSQEPVQFRGHLSRFRRLTRQWGFDNLRLLVSIRRQADVFASRYAQGSGRHLGASQSDFEQRVRSYISMTQTYQQYNYHGHGVTRNYEHLWKAMVEAVGAENILMLPYEMMKEDLSSFMEAWLSFINIDMDAAMLVDKAKEGEKIRKRNVRSSSENRWALRPRSREGAQILNMRPTRLFQALGLPTKVPLRWPDFNRDDEIHLTPELRAEVMNFYESSNRATAEAIGIDLGQYGYY